MGLIELIIILVILGVCWYLVNQLPLPAPIKTVISVVAVIALCLVLLQFIGIDTGLKNVHL